MSLEDRDWYRAAIKEKEAQQARPNAPQPRRGSVHPALRHLHKPPQKQPQKQPQEAPQNPNHQPHRPLDLIKPLCYCAGTAVAVFIVLMVLGH